ncbi:Pectinesterase, partial [Actinidia chinensis var. chinensis]
MASLRAYGKVDKAKQERLDTRRKTRKRVTIIVLSSIVLTGVIVAAVEGGISAKDGSSARNGGSVSTSVKVVCDGTLYPDSCYSSLNPLVRSSHEDQPEKFFKLSVKVAKDELSRASQFFSENGPLPTEGDKMSIAALKSCRALLGLALDHLE